MIYGQETTQYTYEYIDNNSAIIDGTLDWTVEDVTPLIINNANINDPITKVAESAGVKEVTATVSFDDGWGNIYRNTATIKVTVVPYNPPLLDIDWLPELPKGNEETTFSQLHNDTRNLTYTYGEISEINIDQFNDMTFEHTNLTKLEDFKLTFPNKGFYDIRVQAIYNNGWTEKIHEKIFNIEIVNTPPVSNYLRLEDNKCVPSYTWNATSYDADGDTLSHLWTLKDSSNNTIASSSSSSLSYVFQNEGIYTIKLVSTDSAGASHSKEESFDIVIDTCDSNGNGNNTITVERQFYFDWE